MLKQTKRYQAAKIFLIIFLSIQHVVFAQQDSTLLKGPHLRVNYSVLPGKNYTFSEIIADSTLPFSAGGIIHPSLDSVYWLKIIIDNPGHTSGQYNMFIEPSIFNIIYYFDANAQTWIADSAGIMITPPNARKQVGALPFIVNRQPVSVVYIKMNLARLNQVDYSIKPVIQFEENAVTEKQQDVLIYGWVAALSVLFFFFLYNLYLYTNFRDRSVLLYLIAQVGAMLYVTAYRGLFKFVLPGRVFSFTLLKNSRVNYYDVDNILQHAGIILIIYGFVQLTRSYLGSKTFLPWSDRVLKYALYSYLSVSCILIIINTVFFYLEWYTLPYDNIFLLLLISIIIYTSILGYRRKLKASGSFLLANILPLLLMVSITVFHLVVSIETINDAWLPTLAIVSQAFCFSVALVTRTKLIQKELNARQLEAQQLNFEVQKIGITIQAEKAYSALLQERLEANQRELASTTLYMVQKNEMLATLRGQIEELNRLYPKSPHVKLSGMKSVLKSSLNLDDDWQKFKLHFELVHPGFFDDLRIKHPNLTKNEVRLYAYFHINLSHKEIASLLNIEPDSVRRAKSRLFKKMGIAEANGNDEISPEEDS